MSPKNDYLIWIDLEMTGLNAEQDRIIEIATVITDSQLQVVATGPVLAIHQPESLMNAMGEWCQTTHTASGLCKRVKESTVSESQAEQLTLDFLAQYVGHNTSPMCGNSIWNDRRFLVKYMPKLEAFFHYRMVDVSTLKELAKRWRPDLYNSFVKETKHQALDDIHESIDELKFYRETFLVDKKI